MTRVGFIILGVMHTKNISRILKRDVCFGKGPYTKGGKIVWTFVEDNIIKENMENTEI